MPGSEKIVEFHFIDTKKTTFYRQGFRALKMLRIIESSHGGGWSPTDRQQQDPCERTVPQVRACRVGGHCCSGQGCRAPSGCGDRKYKHPSDQEMDPGNPSLLISETGENRNRFGHEMN